MKDKKVGKLVPIRKGDNLSANEVIFIKNDQSKKPSSSIVVNIRQSIIWFNIFIIALCALVSFLNIWLDNALYDLVSKSWSTFFVLGFLSTIIYLIVPLLDKE